ncbi:hypothetical protein [Aeromicrobium endophyticum]|uniref:Uncharacterized protein n=1 Tax=Aeromicrobium endophyticum TaxID=2292704 RepID=A0A371PB94_9ACTN|nr:hypothetical protein [Aeromicrobium endophyticum]REK73191.1 hypothetical protein DX116_06380 [Aeromicrobium endophyticum]
MGNDTNLPGDVIGIRVMNEYGGGLPLWPDDVDTDVEALDLSAGLRTDLMAFADRWDAAIPPEVYDDRWDGVPVMQLLVRAKYALGRRLHPARERAVKAEDEAIRRTGESLAVRVQQELGPGFDVAYVHG